MWQEANTDIWSVLLPFYLFNSIYKYAKKQQLNGLLKWNLQINQVETTALWNQKCTTKIQSYDCCPQENTPPHPPYQSSFIPRTWLDLHFKSLSKILQCLQHQDVILSLRLFNTFIITLFFFLEQGGAWIPLAVHFGIEHSG